MEKMSDKFLWPLFLGALTVETVLKRFWMWHCSIQLNISNLIQIVTYFFRLFVTTNDVIVLMFNVTFCVMNKVIQM